MEIYLLTRGKYIDYAFIGKTPREIWWGEYEKWIDFTYPAVVFISKSKTCKMLISGIPSSEQDSLKTSTRYMLILENIDIDKYGKKILCIIRYLLPTVKVTEEMIAGLGKGKIPKEIIDKMEKLKGQEFVCENYIFDPFFKDKPNKVISKNERDIHSLKSPKPEPTILELFNEHKPTILEQIFSEAIKNSKKISDCFDKYLTEKNKHDELKKLIDIRENNTLEKFYNDLYSDIEKCVEKFLKSQPSFLKKNDKVRRTKRNILAREIYNDINNNIKISLENEKEFPNIKDFIKVKLEKESSISILENIDLFKKFRDKKIDESLKIFEGKELTEEFKTNYEVIKKKISEIHERIAGKVIKAISSFEPIDEKIFSSSEPNDEDCNFIEIINEKNLKRFLFAIDSAMKNKKDRFAAYFNMVKIRKEDKQDICELEDQLKRLDPIKFESHAILTKPK